MSNAFALNGKIMGGMVIPVENMTLLWKNPDPTSAFGAQTITLSSGDYDFLLFVARVGAGSNRQISEITSKGSGILMSYAVDKSIRSRLAEYTNDTKYAVADAISSTIGGGTSETNNLACIPVAVYGIKKNGVANDVSTKAEDCYLTTGKSVEEELNKGSVSVIADGTKTWTTLLNELFGLVDMSKINYNSKLIQINSASAQDDYVYNISYISSSNIGFGCPVGSYLYVRNLSSSGSFYKRFTYSDGTFTDLSSNVPLSGIEAKIIY